MVLAGARPDQQCGLDAAERHGACVRGGSIAIGSNTQATANSATAIGVQAYASAHDAVALGSGSVADQANTVSVGSNGTGYTGYDENGQPYTIQNAVNTRRIVNMAAGQANTDAVNVGQLRGVTTALGGGAAVNADGTVSGPNYSFGGRNYTDIGSALEGVNDAAQAGLAQAVMYDTPDHDKVTLGGTGASTPVQLTNVANATQGSVFEPIAIEPLPIARATSLGPVEPDWLARPFTCEYQAAVA